MYIKYNDQKYSCTCQPSKNVITYRGLSDDFPHPVDGIITLCADNDFVMRTDNTADYLRQTFVKGTLTLSNNPELPEPETPITPEPSLKDRVASLETELEESKAKNLELENQITDTQLALCEVYEMML